MSNLPLCSEQLSEQVIIAVCMAWNLQQDSLEEKPWKKKDNPFSSIVGITVLEVREMQPPFSSANDPVHSGAAVFASAASREMLGWVWLFPLKGSSWWKALSAQRSPSVHKWAVTATSGNRKLPSRLQWAEQEANLLELYLFLLY